MENFWASEVWAFINLIAVLLVSLLAANVLKRTFRFLQESLIPTSVLGGGILLLIASIYKLITGNNMFDTTFFGGNGSSLLEMITYHMLALGFIASAFKSNGGKITKKRTVEIFDSGVTTVASYLIQAIVGLAITIIVALIVKGFFSAAGVLLPFGYGQGTGQAMNYGNIYETEYGFAGGKSFGLTIAALGFLCASIGGVIHLNILRRRGVIAAVRAKDAKIKADEVEGNNEIPMQESIDKLTIQIALIFVAYALAFVLMTLLGLALPGMKAVIFGFNFLLGVLAATLVKTLINLLHKKNVIKKVYVNNFLMTRASNFFFDIMVTAGIAAIRISILKQYWYVIVLLGVAGLVVTYVYNRIVAKTFFKEYAEEQFLAMFGMLTGTASTGIILLREVDGEFKTPAADNLVYQQFPAIVFGFPMMLLATLAPKKPLLTLVIFILFFIVMNVILFRSKIFKFGKKSKK